MFSFSPPLYLLPWNRVLTRTLVAPDVALVHTIGGLSANPPQGYSAPDGAAALFGGIIARLNDELVSAGKPTLGFLNPWIYKNQDAFNDITIGKSPLCLPVL